MSSKLQIYRGFLLRNFLGSISASVEEGVEVSASGSESCSTGADNEDAAGVSSVWEDLAVGTELCTTANTFTRIQ